MLTHIVIHVVGSARHYIFPSGLSLIVSTLRHEMPRFGLAGKVYRIQRHKAATILRNIREEMRR